MERCVRRSCDEDTTGQAHYGHCLNCGRHIGARIGREWAQLVKAPCPTCVKAW